VGLDVSGDLLATRIARRADEMIARGAPAEARAALAAGASRTASRALGLRELAELPPDDARDALMARTRRYAAYQRKWMRRIPGIALVDGDRDPHDVAADILTLARPE